jgi:hypothetical protein
MSPNFQTSSANPTPWRDRPGSCPCYVFEPQWQIREHRISEELENTEVTYLTVETWDDDIMLTRCPSFFEAEMVRGDSTQFNIQNLKLALPEDLPWPEDVDLAVDGNRFMITGYRHEVFEVNVLTGTRRQVSYVFPRFDVVGWEVVMPYSKVDGSTPGEDRPTLEGRITPIAHRTAATDHPPGMFHEFEGSAFGPCMTADRIRLLF